MKIVEAANNLFRRVKAYRDWWKFYLSDYSFEVTTRKYGSKLRVRNDSDRFIIDEVFAHSQFEIIPLDQIDNVLDIGAYSGYSVSYFVENQCKVAAFEPGPAFSNLEYNIELNGYDVGAFNKAVSSHDGKVSLTGGSESTLKTEGENGGVECVSLDKAMKLSGFKDFDLLKMDCEGEEVPIIIESSSETLKEFNWIFAEYHSLEGKSEIVDRLEEIGFEVKDYDSFADNDDGFVLAEHLEQ